MKNFIKVLNPEVANELVLSGFNYTTEKINTDTVYCFADSKELREYLMRNYSSKDYFENNRLCF